MYSLKKFDDGTVKSYRKLALYYWRFHCRIAHKTNFVPEENPPWNDWNSEPYTPHLDNFLYYISRAYDNEKIGKF